MEEGYKVGDLVDFCDRTHRVRRIITVDNVEHYEFVDIKHGGVYILSLASLKKSNPKKR